MAKAFQWHCDDHGIVHLYFDSPGEKVNKLSSRVLDELKDTLAQIRNHKTAKALIIKSRKPDLFIAGADIDELKQVRDSSTAQALSEKGHEAFNLISSLPFPTIAAIDGACLGGGLELALACTYRIVTDSNKTALGLPEVNLGIIPGWGGTQRLPRLIGLTAAMEMIMTGKTVDGRKAFKMKLADAIFSAPFLEEKSLEFALLILDPKTAASIVKKRKQNSWMLSLVEGTGLGRKWVFNQARQTVMAKTKGQYPSPLKALEVLESTYKGPLQEGLQKEIKAVSSLIESPIARHLIQLYVTTEAIKKDPGIALSSSAPLPAIRSAGVLGAGVMGGGIAWLFANKGIPVRLKDINWDAIAKGYHTAHEMFNELVKIRKLKPREVNLCMHRITSTIEYTGFKNIDIVVEAVVEDMAVKKNVLEELEKHVSPTAIICTNTSALPIEEMAAGLKHPERFIGLHFFNPVNRMPLVEIVPGKKTSPQVVAAVVEMVKSLGKTPVVVGACPGFLVNRILLAALNEAGWLYEEGVPIERIDRALESFGMPMGPFRLVDEVGIDVSAKVGAVFEKSYGKRMKLPAVFQKAYEDGLRGKKTGKGFYIHSGKKSWINTAVPSSPSSTGRNESLTDKQIVERFIFSMVNEASRCIEEGVVARPDYLDLAMVMGAGFPPFRGGLLKYADEVGIAYVVESLEELSRRYGERFFPSALLVRMKKEGRTFHSNKEKNLRNQDHQDAGKQNANSTKTSLARS